MKFSTEAVHATVDAKLVMATIKEGIEGTNEALNMYDKLIERVVPWKEFKESLAELDKYRNDFSAENALLIGDVKTHMMNGIDAYFYASQNTFEWASFSVSHLKLFIDLFNGHDAKKFETQKRLIIELLDNGVAQMGAAHAELGNAVFSFSSAIGKLTALRKDFRRKIKKLIFGLEDGNSVKTSKLLSKMSAILKFYDDLKRKVKHATENIIDATEILQTEIQHIYNLETQTEQEVWFVNLDEVSELRDMIIQSTQHLIADCEQYQKKHNSKFQ